MIGQALGPYRILAKLGEGGMGEVYRAHDTRLDRVVAVKVLPARLASIPGSIERFRREARAIAALNHPHICTIHDIHSGDALAGPYLAMELVEGETLHRRLQRGVLPVAEIVDIGVALADALEAAHARGIVHRDIKPTNIMLTARGPKILDFGLAKAAAAAPPASFEPTRPVDVPLTDPGATVGTLAYMSPEQLRGEEIDARSDLFSLGLVLYEMSTGRPAFTGATSAMVSAAILHDPPPAPRALRGDLPAPLEEIILKALEKDRTLRCQSASELRADLRRFARAAAPASVAPASAAASPAGVSLPASGAASPPSSDAQLAAALMRRHRLGALVAALVLVVLAAGGTALWVRGTVNTAASVSAPSAEGTTSIAVLPFENRSADPDQDYLADGISEQVRMLLVRIPGLRVTARESAFYFKGRNEDPRTIGETLDVEYILAGGVQKSGERLRITVELLDASTLDQHWSHTYDRVFADIFDVQDDIAARVATALQLTLGVGVGSVPGMTRNPDAYDAFLRAEGLLNQYQPDSLRAAIEHARRAVALDPSSAISRLLLAAAYEHAAANISDLDTAEEWRRLRAVAIDEAAALAPDAPAVQSALVVREMQRGNLLVAGSLFRDLLAAPQRAPSTFLGYRLHTLGRAGEAIRELEAARAADPLSGATSLRLAVAYGSAGRLRDAFAEFDRGLQLPESAEVLLRASRFVTALGARDQGEIDRFFAMLDPDPDDGNLNALLSRWMDGPAAARSEIRRLEVTLQGQGYVNRSILAFWAAYYGHPDLALEYVDDIFDVGIDGSLPWRYVFRDMRRLPAFKEFLRQRGFVDYWKEFGWGDFCKPTVGDDFECQ